MDKHAKLTTSSQPEIRTPAGISSRVKSIIAASRRGRFAGKRVHFVGIGGIGMSAIAMLARGAGAIVTGSDLTPSEICERLRTAGISVQRGHSIQSITDADIAVFSSAIREDNPEMLFARREGIRIMARSEMLFELARDKHTIGVSGAHGKTTTTWLCAHLLIEANRDPSAMIGGIVPQLGTNYRIGTGNDFVTEIDESDGRMVSTPVDTAIITNIDLEHLDHYATLDDIRDTFRRWASQARVVIACGDDPIADSVLRSLSGNASPEIIRYGFGPQNDVRATRLSRRPSGSVFDVEGTCGSFKGLTLAMPGDHNVLNALAALTVARRAGAGEDELRSALAGCRNVKRRFDIKGVVNGVRVVDDYGHHPTEIRATLAAARPSTEGRMIVVFQPHRYSRTLHLMSEFATAFDEADQLMVMDIYAAGEAPIPGLSGHSLVNALNTRRKTHPESYIPEATYTPTIQDAVDHLSAAVQSGDTVITMGAGDVWRVGHELVERF